MNGRVVAVGDGVHGVPAGVEGKGVDARPGHQVRDPALLRHLLGVPALFLVEDSGCLRILTEGGRDGRREGGREGQVSVRGGY